MTGRVVSPIVLEVADERVRQDRQWGGPDHDDGHSIGLWLELLDERIDKVTAAARDEDMKQVRKQMIILAALAVAFVESLDRKAWRRSNFPDD